MNRFSKTQIYLHWITLLFVAITYAAMELRGWFLDLPLYVQTSVIT